MQEECKTYSVYMHTNLVNSKRYIGKCKNKPSSRWGTNGHGYLTKKKGKYNQPAFAHAILKYGWDNFEHEIISDNLTNAEACQIEQEYIALYQTRNPNFGYNLTNGGEGSSGRKCSEESRKKMSESQHKRFESQEERDKISRAHLGKSEPGHANPGHPISEETKQKISKANKGRRLSQETKYKLSKANKGKKLSEETRRKMSEGQQGVKAHHYGKQHSEESKRKISESKKGKKVGKDNINSKPVLCVETGIVYESMSLAAQAIGQKTYAHISDCCHHKRNVCGGYHWKFVED